MRERRQDIPLLVHFLVTKFAARIGKHLDGVSRQTLQRLGEYPWPGNIRELENVLERAVILAAGATLEIGPDFLLTPAPDARPPEQAKVKNAACDSDPGDLPQAAGKHLATLHTLERDYVLKVLQQTNWVVHGSRGAAQILAIHPNTLRNRMKKLGIERPSH